MHALATALALNWTRIVLLVVCVASACFFLRFLFALVSEERGMRQRQSRLVRSFLMTMKPSTEDAGRAEGWSERGESTGETVKDSLSDDSRNYQTKIRWLILPLVLVAMMNLRLAATSATSGKDYQAVAPICSNGDRSCRTYFGSW